jgi:hypothetical protein
MVRSGPTIRIQARSAVTDNLPIVDILCFPLLECSENAFSEIPAAEFSLALTRLPWATPRLCRVSYEPSTEPASKGGHNSSRARAAVRLCSTCCRV